MSATAPTTTVPSVDTSEWPESYVRNGYSEQRGGDDVLFTITPKVIGDSTSMLECGKWTHPQGRGELTIVACGQLLC
jgi:hypothetical protein